MRFWQIYDDSSCEPDTFTLMMDALNSVRHVSPEDRECMTLQSFDCPITTEGMIAALNGRHYARRLKEHDLEELLRRYPGDNQ